jgi:hypothetical protein
VHVDFAAFWLYKDGGGPRDYEDAFAPAAVDAAPRARLRCAVADGATESAFSRLWARQLVSGFVSGRLTAPDLAELPLIGRRWARSVAHALGRDERTAWYLERKADDGAFAALVGLEFAARPELGAGGGTYAAIALGDSCFVHVHADAISRAFPLDRAAGFSARPVLLPSRPAPADDFAGAIARVGGTWRPGDTFYVMSDALACWFLASAERGDRPWRELDRFGRADRAAFRDWVQELRPSKLKNDDVTLLRITVR